MMPSQTAIRRTPVLRNTCTVAAMLGFGMLTGALLAETSLLNFNFSRPNLPRIGSFASDGYGYLTPSDSRGMSRRPASQPRGISAHHSGVTAHHASI